MPAVALLIQKLKVGELQWITWDLTCSSVCVRFLLWGFGQELIESDYLPEEGIKWDSENTVNERQNTTICYFYSSRTQYFFLSQVLAKAVCCYASQIILSQVSVPFPPVVNWLSAILALKNSHPGSSLNLALLAILEICYLPSSISLGAPTQNPCILIVKIAWYLDQCESCGRVQFFKCPLHHANFCPL